MFDPDAIDRRSFVKGVGGAMVASTALAGCSSDGDSGNGNGNENGGGGTPPTFDGWLSNANAYDGVVDKTGSDEVTVEVGAGSAGTAFDPPAIRISTGTTVVWEWTGVGGMHNVVEQGSDGFSSELTSSEGHTYSQTFDETGTVKYYCNPHKTVGMKGVVVVE